MRAAGSAILRRLVPSRKDCQSLGPILPLLRRLEGFEHHLENLRTIEPAAHLRRELQQMVIDSDQDMIEQLTILGETGRIPWEWIADETRELESFTGSSTVAEDLLGFLSSADSTRGTVPRL